MCSVVDIVGVAIDIVVDSSDVNIVVLVLVFALVPSVSQWDGTDPRQGHDLRTRGRQHGLRPQGGHPRALQGTATDNSYSKCYFLCT